ncbi:MAG: hypothetical protein AB7K24_22885 [Gemmataceae bacterium]
MKQHKTLWIAAGLSLVLHSALLLSFTQFEAPRAEAEDRPLIVDTIALLDDDESFTMTLTLPEEPPASPVVQAAPNEVPSERAGPPSSGGNAQNNTHTSTGSGNPTPKGSGIPAPFGARGTGQGDRAGTSFFQVGTKARSVVYVLDRSVSMGLNGTLEIVKRELLRSLAGLSTDARFQVLFYNSRVEPLQIGFEMGLHTASDENLARLKVKLENLQAEGGTAHLPALRAALALRPDAIYFLTDAADLGAETLHAVCQLNRGTTSIHTIELVRTRQWQPEKSALYRLAQTNRGHYQALAVHD